MMIDVSDLGVVEQWIANETINRLREGQKVYGKWQLESKANFYEAVLEVLDRNNYMDAEKMRRALASSPQTPPNQDRIGTVPPTE